MKRTVAIIGGGVAGLSCAAYLGRAGFDVVVYERSNKLGGRATTQRRDGFDFNVGPHALYVDGAGTAVLRELNIPFTGEVASVSGSFGMVGNTLRTLPTGFVSMLVSSLLSLSAKAETGKMLQWIKKADTSEASGVSAATWLAQIKNEDARALLSAMFRLTTYCADHEILDAGAALRNLQLAVQSGVYYLDGGWQVLVDGLRDAAVAAGARIETSAPVTSITAQGESFSVTSKTGACLADRVIIAASPAVAAKLAPWSGSLTTWARDACPVVAATLDVALSQLPQRRKKFVLGIDQPYYFSVHSETARLAPTGGAMIHVLKYGAGDQPADEVRAELEGLMDLAQPGWREFLVHERFLPKITVAGDTPRVAGRPGPSVPEAPGLYVIGDWVGNDGMLVDTSLASARLAAQLVSQSWSGDSAMVPPLRNNQHVSQVAHGEAH